MLFLRNLGILNYHYRFDLNILDKLCVNFCTFVRKQDFYIEILICNFALDLLIKRIQIY